jgi:hypothetical protein
MVTRILYARMRNMLKDAMVRPGDVGQRAQLRQQIGKSNCKRAGKARLIEGARCTIHPRREGES